MIDVRHVWRQLDDFSRGAVLATALELRLRRMGQGAVAHVGGGRDSARIDTASAAALPR